MPAIAGAADMALASGSDLPVADEDRAYFERRAEEEIERARECTDPRTVAIHYTLSELYLERVGAAPGLAGGHAPGADDGNEPIDAG